MSNALTPRALMLGAVLSIIVAMYSAFLGLKIGGVYWPIITTSIMAMAILTLLKNTNVNEINIAQTAASAGGLLAAGIIFTIPAIFLLGFQIEIWEISAIALIGGILGIMFSIPLREEMIEKEKLPYPDGTAAAKVIKAGDEGGAKSKLLLYTFLIGGLFALMRDYLKAFPSFINLDTLKLSLAEKFSFGSSISLVSIAGGFLIGPRFTGAWFFGAIISYFAIIPYFLSIAAYPDKFAAAVEFTKPLGIGVVIGAAIAYFILKGLPAFLNFFKSFSLSKKSITSKWGILLIVLVASLTYISNLNPLLSVIAIIGAFIMAYVGARVTGEMNVDPMEIFAMIVLIIAKLLFGFNAILLVFLAAIVCISAGMAGDFLQDLKAGRILGTNPREQAIAQTVGVISASLILGLTLYALNLQYGFGGVDLPAPQALAVKEIVAAQSLQFPLLLGVIVGIILTTITAFLNLGILPAAFGIGLYVPIELSFPLFVGGLVRLYIDKTRRTEQWRLVAAGLIGGEGFFGVLIAMGGLILTFL